MPEAILEPELPIVDPHHHLWDRPAAAARTPQPSGPVHPFTQVVAKRPRYLLGRAAAPTCTAATM